MDNFTYKTRAGQVVTLSSIDMQLISEHYHAQMEADYIRENHPELSEEMVLKVAEEVVDDLSAFVTGEDETETIKRAFVKLGLK